MRAVVVVEEEGRSHLRIAEAPEPECGEYDVVITVTASGVNRADLLQRAGKYPPPLGASPILGLEVSGVITQIGARVSGHRVGDEVCALLTGGGYAERVVAPAVQVMRVPSGVTLTNAAGVPEAFITAYTNLFVEADLREGERVLIHGGSSGVGTAAIQLVRASGCRVACTVGSEEKAARCRALGAELAVLYKEQDFGAIVREWAGPEGVDVILDIVGKEYLERNVQLLATRGRLVVIATSSGSAGTLELATLMRKRARVIGSVLRSRSVAEKGALVTGFVERFGELLNRGLIAPVVDSVYPVDDAEGAHQRMKESRHIGKILLRW